MSLIGVLNLRLQAFTPSDHMWSTFLLKTPPQFLNQAPPGAQQLALPDFWNVPHFEHLKVLAIVEVKDGVLAMSSRSVIGRRDTYWRAPCVVAGVGTDVHTVSDTDPDESSNMSSLLALDWTQAAPQSVCLNDVACSNILSMLTTLDTSHFEMSPLNNPA